MLNVSQGREPLSPQIKWLISSWVGLNILLDTLWIIFEMIYQLSEIYKENRC